MAGIRAHSGQDHDSGPAQSETLTAGKLMEVALRHFLFLALSIVVLAAAQTAPALANSQEAIGQVKVAEGDAALLRGEQRIDAAPGIDVHEGDVIVTGGDGKMGVTFRDETLISVGPDTRIAVNEYVFEPAQGKLGFVAQMTQGTLQFISGVIAKLSPESVALRTPTGTIGVRGTRFLVKVTP